jgi:hypothetical protein
MRCCKSLFIADKTLPQRGTKGTESFASVG